MTRMTGPDCVVMCNLINTYIHVTYREMLAHLRAGDDILRIGFIESFPIMIYNYHYK